VLACDLLRSGWLTGREALFIDNPDCLSGLTEKKIRAVFGDFKAAMPTFGGISFIPSL
jgi:hypothetical protein